MYGSLIVLLAVVALFVAYLLLTALYSRSELTSVVPGQSDRPLLTVGSAPSHPMLRHLLEGPNVGSSNDYRSAVLPTLPSDETNIPDRTSDVPLHHHRGDSPRRFPAQNSLSKRANSTVQSSVVQQQRLPQCVICLDKGKDILLKPCRHFCVCSDCAFALVVCPVCRKPIEDREKIYDT